MKYTGMVNEKRDRISLKELRKTGYFPKRFKYVFLFLGLIYEIDNFKN